MYGMRSLRFVLDVYILIDLLIDSSLTPHTSSMRRLIPPQWLLSISSLPPRRLSVQSFTERTGKGDPRFSRHFLEWQGKCWIIDFPAICWDVMVDRMRRHPKWPAGNEVFQRGRPDAMSSNMVDRLQGHPRWSSKSHALCHHSNMDEDATSSNMADQIWCHPRWSTGCDVRGVDTSCAFYPTHVALNENRNAVFIWSIEMCFIFVAQINVLFMRPFTKQLLCVIAL